MAKKQVTHLTTEATDQTISKYDLEGKQADIMHRIAVAFARARDDMTEKLGEGVPFDLYTDWRPRGYDDSDELTIYVNRPETTAEALRRQSTAQEQKDRQKEHDLRVLADLTKKYGSSHR